MNKENNNKKIKSGLKIFGVSVLSFVVLLGLSSVGGTVSYFNDTEESLGNYLRADPISFKVDTPLTQIDLTSEKQIEIVMTPDETSEPIQYFVTSKVISGGDTFCRSINAFGTWPFPINGKVDSIVTDVSTSTGSWTLTASVPEEERIANNSCVVELSYFGWNAGAELGHAFTDTRTITFEFFIPSTYVNNSVKVFTEPVSSSQPVDITPSGGEGDPTQATSTEAVPEENSVPEDALEVSPTPTPTPEVTLTPEPTVTPTPAPEVVSVPEPTPTPTDTPPETVETPPSQS